MAMFVFDKLGEGTYHAFKASEVFVKTRSPFQEILICRLTDFGKALFLDGSLQAAEADQHLYHRALVEPALKSVGDPKQVLIIGGGDGAAANLILSQKKTLVTLVEIDEMVVQLSREYLKEFNGDVFGNPNLKVVYKDGKEFIEKTHENYDIIVVDVTDPGVGDLANTIYNESFFESVKEHLRENGVMVTQAGSTWFGKESFKAIGGMIRKVFPSVVAYGEFVHSFGSLWGFYLSAMNQKRNLYGIVEDLGYKVL